MKSELSKTSGTLQELFRQAFVIRAVEERLLALFTQGKLFGTVHTCIGQELSGLSIAANLQPEDLIFSNHRCHGHFLARTGDVEGLIAEMMGKQTGVCAGRGGSLHLCSRGFFSNSILGSNVPVGAGMAFALKLRQSNGIAVVFIGDGTLGEGVLYETLNIAGKWELPLLFVLENNRYAQSTSQKQTLSGDIQARAAAFGIVSDRAEVWSPDALALAAAKAVECVRQKRQPFFLQIDCDRLAAHSKGDDNRDADELAGYRRRDPLQVFTSAHVKEALLFKTEAEARVDAVVAKVESAPVAVLNPEEEDAGLSNPVSFRKAPPSSAERTSAQIYSALHRNMEKNPRIVLLGEDIEAPYGGAFKVTKTLSVEFPGRVRNTPVSEAAIVGLGSGLALQGFTPVVEIMFGDFLMLAGDQFLNAAAKFRHMYNGQSQVPLIIRTPMGGRRGYGPTHSQSLEKHFLGVPGTMVLALNACHDAGALYDALFDSIDRPTLIIENKLLYGAVGAKAPLGFALELSDERFPTARLRPDGVEPDCTILCYGGMFGLAEEAAMHLFEKSEIACEIICPEQLYPFNAEPLRDSIRRTGRLLTVEEGQGFAAFGAEALADLTEKAPGALKAARRLAAARLPIPAAASLEKTALPGAEAIEKAVQELLGA